MYEHVLPVPVASGEPPKTFIEEKYSNLLVKEYQYWNTFLEIQPEGEKAMISLQANQLAEALSYGMEEVTITFPDGLDFPLSGNGQNETKRLALSEAGKTITWHKNRGWINRKTFLQTIQNQIVLLENSLNPASAAFGGLLRFTLARSLICKCVPAGNDVLYLTKPGEDIPSIPYVRDSSAGKVENLGESYANRFYLPRYVAFDDDGQFLVDSVDDAETCVVMLQNYLGMLKGAIILAPYMVVDQVYRKKYYGILGQFINQSRVYCRYLTHEIIATIRRRIESKSLNRGLSISMPFCDDQALVLRKLEFEIIPPGRVMFVPALLIMAVQEQMTIVRHNTGLNFTTRRHLLDQLETLIKAFDREMD